MTKDHFVFVRNAFSFINYYFNFFVEKNNNNIVASQNEKYRQITRPDGKRISLLIQNFQPRDCGIYRCVAINPLTRERKYSPDAVNLKIISKCSFLSSYLYASLVFVTSFSLTV